MERDNQINLTEQNSRISIEGSEKRKNLKLYVAGGLAAILWITLGAVIGYQCYSTFKLSIELSKVGSEEIAKYIKEAIQQNKEVAQTIYTFLTPLAAAVTTFFFDVTQSYNDDD